MVRGFLIGAAVALAFGCGHHPPAPGTGGGSGVVGNTGGGGGAERVVVSDMASAKGHAGEVVEVKGTAGNAMLGLAIAVDGGPIYCMAAGSPSEWPAELVGKPVIARGTLEQTDEFTAKQPTEQGTNGQVFVLRDCDYRTP